MSWIAAVTAVDIAAVVLLAGHQWLDQTDRCGSPSYFAARSSKSTKYWSSGAGLPIEIKAEPQLGVELQRLANRDHQLSPVHPVIVFDEAALCRDWPRW